MAVPRAVRDASPLDGEDVAHGICDVIERMLPRVPDDDILHASLGETLTNLQALLGRPLTPRRT